jgi:transposase-like protein
MMMSSKAGEQRWEHTDEFKAKVAFEAVKGVHTLSELSPKYAVHSTVIAQWKRRLIEGAAGVFETQGIIEVESVKSTLVVGGIRPR